MVTVTRKGEQNALLKKVNVCSNNVNETKTSKKENANRKSTISF